MTTNFVLFCDNEETLAWETENNIMEEGFQGNELNY